MNKITTKLFIQHVFITLALLLIANINISMGQWTDNGSTLITYDKVGIGINNPNSLLEISGPDSQLLIDATGTGNDAVIFFDAINNMGVNHNVATIIGDAGNGADEPRLNFNIIDGDGGGWNQALTIKATPGNLSTGYVGIGTETPTELLTVAGIGKFLEITVQENTGADFVFNEEYDLPSLSEIESFIQTNRHLPGISSAEEMKRNGVKVGDLQMKLLQKIEELTLYMIEMQKSNRENLGIIKKQQEQIRQLFNENIRQSEQIKSFLDDSY